MIINRTKVSNITGMRITVLGSGITGLFCAYYLLKDGHQVTILEKNPTRKEASYYNAGLLTPSFAPAPQMGFSKVLISLISSRGSLHISPKVVLSNPRWFSFGLRMGMTRYETTIISLGTRSLELYEHFFQEENLFPDIIKGVAGLYNNFEDARKVHSRFGGKLLNSSEIESLGYNRLGGGIKFENELSINPQKMMEGLTEKVVEMGAEYVTGKPFVLKMDTENSRVCVAAESERFESDRIVITVGSWCTHLCRTLRFNPYILPARGLVMIFDTAGRRAVRCPALLEDHGIGVTQHDDSTLRITSFFEMVGFNKDFDQSRKSWLVRTVSKHVPNIEELELVESGVGYRPCTPDQLPLIGRLPRHPDVFIASGNCRLGMTLAPITGHLLTEMIKGDNSKYEYMSPNRFA